MLPNRTATAFCALLLCALTLPSAAEATLITYFNFNNYTVAGDGNSFSAADAGGSGSGVITLESGGNPWPTSALSVDSGSTENLVAGDLAGTALGLGTEEGGTMTINLDSTGYRDLTVSFAYHRPESSFSDAAIAYLEYSMNGNQYVAVDSRSLTTNQFEVVDFDLSGIASIDNASNVSLRITFSDSNGNAQTFLRIDNLQINGTSVPEAPAVAMMVTALVLFGGVAYRRRRTAAGQTVHAQVLAV